MLAEHEKHLADQRQGQRHGDPETPDFAAVDAAIFRLFRAPASGYRPRCGKPGLGHCFHHRRFVAAPESRTRARSAARLTLACMPGCRSSTFSRRAEQAAQVMPPMAKLDDLLESPAPAFAHLTNSTGHAARCSTRFATEPMTSRPMPPRPCPPMTIRSHPSSPAILAITSAGWPT
jgi:hypothetical protein